MNRHLELLARWPAFADRFWYDIPGQPGLGCFGTGFNSWGVQTTQKYLGAMAEVALNPETDFGAVGMSREQVLERTLAALRYNLATHCGVARVPLTDGTQWGRTWISSLGIERMMHAVDALDEHLTEQDRADLRRVFEGEADFLLREYQVASSPWQILPDGTHKPNHPESNYWNGAVLLRAATMYGDHADAAAWTRRGHEYLVNAISVPADGEDRVTVYGGRTVAEWYVGEANFFPHYALDHHAYLNVGYMVICLSNLAMIHYAYALKGVEAPAVIYHHGKDLWQLVRRLVFADGRLARIGGDSRQRYCYCQDYLLPVLVFAADHLGDPLAAHLEAGQLELIAREQEYSGDGSFLSRRLGKLAAASPYYYTRLESDKAVCLAMASMWRRLRPQIPAADRADEAEAARMEAELGGTWVEAEHGAMFHRSATRLASWSWRASDPPQGLCLPPGDGHLAEWSECMGSRVTPVGEVFAYGDRVRRPVRRHTQAGFDGGWVTCGTVIDGLEVVIPEGYRAAEMVRHHLAVAALPDDHSVLRLEWAVAGPRRTYFAAVRGLRLNVANDLFNGFERRLATGSGPTCLEVEVEEGDRPESIIDLGSMWACVEDRLAVFALAGAESLTVYRPGRRTAGYMWSLYADEICISARQGPFDVEAGGTVLDTAALVVTMVDRGDVRAYAEAGQAAAVACDRAEARAAMAMGRDGRAYLLVANFAEEGETDVAVRLAEIGAGTVGRATDLASGETFAVGEGVVRLPVAAGAARLVRLSE